jgi:NAD(P)-dependent dehydrogenase (short-subunit alcohol dehydrogenase family)
VTDHPITPEAADSGPLPADIKGRRAVVTGAGHGIGLAIANHLIMAEARVVAIDKDKEALERNFNGAPGCSWVVDDIARSDIADLAEEVLEHGPVELIVTFVAQRPHYSASKAGVAMLCRELAHELGTRGIRVNAISPGWIRTAEDLDTPEQRAKYELTQPRIPLRRPGEPDDVAKLALLLLSDAWTGYITGANIPVDGGLSLFSWIQRPND